MLKFLTTNKIKLNGFLCLKKLVNTGYNIISSCELPKGNKHMVKIDIDLQLYHEAEMINRKQAMNKQINKQRAFFIDFLLGYILNKKEYQLYKKGKKVKKTYVVYNGDQEPIDHILEVELTNNEIHLLINYFNSLCDNDSIINNNFEFIFEFENISSMGVESISILFE